MLKALEGFVYWLSSFSSGADVDAICALDSLVGLTAKNEEDDDFVIGQVNGDLVTVIDIRGARKFVGSNDLAVMTTNFSKALEKLCKSGSGDQHSFSIGFRSDPDQALRLVGEILAPQMLTARRFGIENVRMLTERRAMLAKHCVDETVYLVIRTHKSALQPHERKTQVEERIKIIQKIVADSGGQKLSRNLAQVPQAPLGALAPRHVAAVKSLMDDLSRDKEGGGAQLLLKCLSAHEAVNIIRRHVDARPTSLTWRPRLLGDKSAALGSSAVERGNDASPSLQARLSRQMVTTSVSDRFGSRELCEQGGLWYGSVVLELPPDEGSEPFHELATRLGKTIPWRVAFEIYPNGKNYRKMERFLSAMLGAVGDYNKSIRKGFDHLKALSGEGVYVGAVRAVFSTWGPTEHEVAQRLANLISSVESWGSAGCTNETGEPARAMLASAAGFASIAPAPYIPAPMHDIVRMMPFSRPASIWDRGQIVMSTLEGRPYPIDFGSSLQNYWSTIGFAPTGSGKSFTLNVLNSGLLLAPGAQEVPPITLVDVGLSGKLVMDWFRSILPPHMREQVLSISIRNDVDFAVNPFDTQHGFDMPLPGDVDYLTAVLGTISPGCGPEATKFFERVIRVCYEKFGRESPDGKKWQNAFDAQVSRALEEIGFVVTEKTRVWSVVDALFDAGMIEESVSAQRFAMPTLQDVPKIAADQRVSNVYGEAKFNDELIIKVFTRNIVASLDSYAILSGYTKFNLGAARAVSIDLQEVVGSMNTEEGRRKSGLMFLLARRIGARNYFLKWEEVSKLCPQRYAAYQEKRISKLWETIKFLQYDESHYFSGIEAVTTLVHSDLRTGRKFNLITALFSQLLADFPEAVLENTYIFFIMGMGDASPDLVRKTFALSSDEMKAISDYCNSPGTMFARFKTQRGTLSQIVRLHASAYERFAFTTQGRDQALRSALSKMLPYDKVLDLLTDKFPGGTAEPYLRKLVAQRANASSMNDESDEALATQVAKQMVEEYDPG
jgi:intracellular multiplication protein IcmB